MAGPECAFAAVWPAAVFLDGTGPVGFVCERVVGPEWVLAEPALEVVRPAGVVLDGTKPAAVAELEPRDRRCECRRCDSSASSWT